MENSYPVSGVNSNWAYPILEPADIETRFLELVSTVATGNRHDVFSYKNVHASRIPKNNWHGSNPLSP